MSPYANASSAIAGEPRSAKRTTGSRSTTRSRLSDSGGGMACAIGMRCHIVCARRACAALREGASASALASSPAMPRSIVPAVLASGSAYQSGSLGSKRAGLRPSIPGRCRPSNGSSRQTNFASLTSARRSGECFVECQCTRPVASSKSSSVANNFGLSVPRPVNPHTLASLPMVRSIGVA